MKIGDKVRFLSEVGGGVVTGFKGKDFVAVENGIFYYFGSDGALASQRGGISDGWLLFGSVICINAGQCSC